MYSLSAVAVGQLWAAIENPVNVLLMAYCLFTGFSRNPIRYPLTAAAVFFAFEVTAVYLNGTSHDFAGMFISHAWTKPLLAVVAWSMGIFVAGSARKTKPEP